MTDLRELTEKLSEALDEQRNAKMLIGTLELSAEKAADRLTEGRQRLSDADAEVYRIKQEMHAATAGEPTPQQGAEVPEGFTAWDNGPIRPGGPSVRVECLHRNSDEPRTRDCADNLRWSHTGAPDDIIAYRILESEEGEGANEQYAENAYYSPDTETDPSDELLDATRRHIASSSNAQFEPQPSTGGEEDGPLAETTSASNSSSEQPEAISPDPLNMAGGGGLPPEPTSANAYWGGRYKPASEEQKQGSTEAQSPLTNDQLTHIGKGA